ncbi:hypothetical protein [Amycolatopsis alba]|uniref:Uncharacterized protein n=1 Tax=Amycolatopsis alba DSM 44262 TaxID=1125972 RepID=A0A229RY10_AMYAL|nr:hypothetical protein [Amycolatopsis alba]OXM51415.1 hypothetical protein CFP75_13255 [Amycolatopsis alba DSM 44262]
MTDPKEFRRACHEAARRTRGQVVRFVPGDQGRNFDTGEIAYPHRTVAVVWTQDGDEDGRHEILGIADAFITFGTITFVDEPGLLAVLGELLPGHRLYSRAELEAPIDPTAPRWKNHYDVKYWRPDCLGQVLFSCWD